MMILPPMLIPAQRTDQFCFARQKAVSEIANFRRDLHKNHSHVGAFFFMSARWSFQYFMTLTFANARKIIFAFWRKAFRVKIRVFGLLRWKKWKFSVAERKAFIEMHNAVGKLHSTQFVYFYTVNSSIRDCCFLFRSSNRARSSHKTFIYGNWCFQWRNSKSFYDFSNSIFYNCRYVILYFNSRSPPPPLPTCWHVIREKDFWSEPKNEIRKTYSKAHQIFTCHITEWNKWNKSKIQALQIGGFRCWFAVFRAGI